MRICNVLITRARLTKLIKCLLQMFCQHCFHVFTYVRFRLFSDFEYVHLGKGCWVFRVPNTLLKKVFLLIFTKRLFSCFRCLRIFRFALTIKYWHNSKFYYSYEHKDVKQFCLYKLVKQYTLVYFLCIPPHVSIPCPQCSSPRQAKPYYLSSRTGSVYKILGSRNFVIARKSV